MTSINLNTLICRGRKPELLAQVGFDDIRISLNFSWQALSDGTPEIKHKHAISDTHDERHIVFNKYLSDSKLFFDIQDHGGNVFRFIKAHPRNWFIQQQELRLLT